MELGHEIKSKGQCMAFYDVQSEGRGAVANSLAGSSPDSGRQEGHGRNLVENQTGKGPG